MLNRIELDNLLDELAEKYDCDEITLFKVKGEKRNPMKRHEGYVFSGKIVNAFDEVGNLIASFEVYNPENNGTILYDVVMS